jgi:hypothetical protein
MSDADESNLVEARRESKNDIPEKPDWKGFFSECLSNLTLTMLVALIGANFLYLTSLGHGEAWAAEKKKSPEKVWSNSLNLIFPSEYSEYFVSKQTGGKCDHSERAKKGVLLQSKLKALGIGEPPSSGWPYTMKDPNNDTIDFTAEGVKNWFALSTSYVFCSARAIIKSFLSRFNKGEDNILSNDIIQIISINALLILLIVFAPLLPCVVLLVLFVAVFISFCMNAWSDDIIFFLVVTFLGPAFWLSCGLTGVMALQAILTLLVLPLYIDWKAVFDSMICNSFLFTTTFLILTTITAFKNNLPIGLIGGLVVSIALALRRTLKNK